MNELYTLTTLADYLNNTYGSKRTGKKFTQGDVQSYIRRGYLPKYLGTINIVQKKDLPGKVYQLVK